MVCEDISNIHLTTDNQCTDNQCTDNQCTDKHRT